MRTKKSETFGVTEQEYEQIAKEIKNIYIEMGEKNIMVGDGIKDLILDKYKGSRLYETAIYITGEIMGKLEMGVQIKDVALQIYNELRKQVENDTNETDKLLKNYKKEKVVN